MLRLRSLLTLGLPLVLVSTTCLSAPIYRWVDKSGDVHYTQSPPAHQGYQRLHLQLPPPSTTPGDAGIAQLSKAYDRHNKAREKQREAALKIKAERAEKCAKARQRISRLQTATAHRLFVVGRDGQRQRMTQPAFEKRLNKAQAQADANCSS